MTWDGKERRNNIDRDRLLTEVHADLKNLVKNFDRHLKAFDDHAKEDKENFDWVKKYIFMAIGGFVVFEIILKMAVH